MNWFEGVDALVSTTANTEVLLDNQAMSPYDYARTPAITEILRDFIEETYKTADDNHPVVRTIEHHFSTTGRRHHTLPPPSDMRA